MLGALAALVAVVLVAAAVYAVTRLVRLAGAARDVLPFLSGGSPAEHAVSRFHVRWYTITMVFLAFDMEMVFMYPWTLVVAEVGTTAVVEMFAFLAVLVAGVWYARREGVFRWT
ncbi:NADH-quinone oxidoreductase subunit A [Amycolatopsis saalfeldensis]|uniref:NADH-quinone oxidoreductase subunit n=1 Tax=Amycolatopsis saalfeldensis TaxID=394193 RepID=A0A1H8YQ74_9PSEU|nr:NADH-quinone oxidoreductase subunit A [Amycolatopsis saalfeldensis]SEP53518.1 NADH-quinone oxidoreductase subunit A [Amycolatopsis saalfeldensis]